MAKNKKEEAEAAPLSSKNLTGSDNSSSSSSDVSLSPRLRSNSLKGNAPKVKKPLVEDESDDDSESEADSGRLASKSKPKSMRTEASSSKLTKKQKALKRGHAEAEAEADAEKTKKAKEGDEHEEGKPSVPFQRIWSDEDEIALLQGMLDYKEQKGFDPMADPNDFLDFIKKKKALHIDVDRKQVVGKVRRLKKRFENSLAGNKKSYTPHEDRAIQISKLIWGGSTTTVADKPTTTTATTKSKASNGFDKHDTDASHTFTFIGKGSTSFGLDENIVKMGLELCSEDAKAEIEDKWKQIYLEDSILFSRKLDLALQETKLITQALR